MFPKQRFKLAYVLSFLKKKIFANFKMVQVPPTLFLNDWFLIFLSFYNYSNFENYIGSFLNK